MGIFLGNLTNESLFEVSHAKENHNSIQNNHNSAKIFVEIISLFVIT